MRIEIDKDLGQLLDQIKDAEPSIYGRGHVETVRFLATYYTRHKPLEELLTKIENTIAKFLGDLNINLEQSLERVILKALTRVVLGILRNADEKHPVERSRAAETSAPGGR